MPLSPAQLRWFFAHLKETGGAFHKKPGAEEKARQHGLVEGKAIVSDNGTRLTVIPPDAEAYRAKLNANPAFENIGKPSKVFHPGENESWRERVPYHSLHIIRKQQRDMYRSHVDRANPREGALPAIVHTGEVAVEAAPAAAGLAAGAALAGEEISKQLRYRKLAAERPFIAHRNWLRREQPPGAAGAFYGSRLDRMAAGIPERGGVVGKVKAVETAARDYRGHKFLQYAFVDEAGQTVGGVGVTVNPAGTGFVGGIPEKAIWSVEGAGAVGGKQIRDALREARRAHPEIKQFVGLHSQKKLRAVGGSYMQAVDDLKNQAAGPAAKAAARAKVLYGRLRLNKMYEQATSVIPVAKGGEKITGEAIRTAKLAMPGLNPRRRLLPLAARRLVNRAPGAAKLAVGAGVAAVGVHEFLKRRRRQGEVVG